MYTQNIDNSYREREEMEGREERKEQKGGRRECLLRRLGI